MYRSSVHPQSARCQKGETHAAVVGVTELSLGFLESPGLADELRLEQWNHAQVVAHTQGLDAVLDGRDLAGIDVVEAHPAGPDESGVLAHASVLLVGELVEQGIFCLSQ